MSGLLAVVAPLLAFPIAVFGGGAVIGLALAARRALSPRRESTEA